MLTTGGGAKFPAPSFNAVYYDSGVYADPSDDPAVEIVRVTGVSTDTLTVTRAQEGTSAANHNTAGHTYTLVAGPTAKLLTDILGISITGSAATVTGAAQTAITSVGTLGGLTVTAAPTFSAMTLGSVHVTGAAGLLAQANANFFWDGTNHRLGIGTTVPLTSLDVRGLSDYPTSASATRGGIFTVYADTTESLIIGAYPIAPYCSWMQTRDPGTGFYPLSLNPLGGNVGIGTAAPSSQLQIGASFGLGTTGANSSWLADNLYYSSGWYYTTTAPGSLIFFNGGDFQVNSCASGTAAAAATFTTKLTVSNLGNVVIGSGALTTSATDGFFYGPSCAGAPTGTPTSYASRIPYVYDTTNHQALFYSGGWVGPGPGVLRTLKETVFAGIATTGYSNGSTYTIDGCDYTCAVATGAAVDMVATGLRIRRGTTSGATTGYMWIKSNATNGSFVSLLGETRFRRGRWGLWVRAASYDFANTGSGTAFAGLAAWVTAASAKWGFALYSRERNANGTPSTTTGGIACDSWMLGSAAAASSYPGVSTADVLCAVVTGLSTMDVYYGTYSSGWPTMESMTLMGRLSGTASGAWLGAATSNPTAGAMDLLFHYGGGVSTGSGTSEIIFDRFRITSWE